MDRYGEELALLGLLEEDVEVQSSIPCNNELSTLCGDNEADLLMKVFLLRKRDAAIVARIPFWTNQSALQEVPCLPAVRTGSNSTTQRCPIDRLTRDA